MNIVYYYTIENRIKFKIYEELGSNGMIPDFDVCSAILEEKGDWAKWVRTDVSFDSDFCKVLRDGLNLLSEKDMLCGSLRRGKRAEGIAQSAGGKRYGAMKQEDGMMGRWEAIRRFEQCAKGTAYMLLTAYYLPLTVHCSPLTSYPH